MEALHRRVPGVPRQRAPRMDHRVYISQAHSMRDIKPKSIGPGRYEPDDSCGPQVEAHRRTMPAYRLHSAQSRLQREKVFIDNAHVTHRATPAPGAYEVCAAVGVGLMGDWPALAMTWVCQR